MATAAFKSATKRTPIPTSSASSTNDSTSSRRNSSSHRRSRSLSQFSRQIPAQDTCNVLDEFPVRFAFFESGDRGRSTSRRNEASPESETPAMQRRGRSVSSRRTGLAMMEMQTLVIILAGEGQCRTLIREEGDQFRWCGTRLVILSAKGCVNAKSSNIGNKQLRKPDDSSKKPVLRKSLSHEDLRPYDGYSAERPVMDRRSHITMRKELRHAAEDSKMANKQDFASRRRNCAINLEKSEKRKQALLEEIAMEEQRHRELSEVVKELLPHSKSMPIQRPSSARKRSSDRRGMSKRLTEEAERYIEDFISNVEDTDISSLDGERSDTTSSSIGGLRSREAFNSPPIPRNVETDGVMLPWLQWETSNEASPASRYKMKEITEGRNQSNHSVSSRGSWGPGAIPVYLGKDLSLEFGESPGFSSQAFSTEPNKGLSCDVYEYLESKSKEDFLIERDKELIQAV